MNKCISLKEAAEMVKTGDMLALGGVTLYRRPLAFTREIIRQSRLSGTPSDLTLLAFTAGLESDLLVGAKIVKQVRSCYFGLEIFGLAPMFTYYANRGELIIIEETEASLAFGLRAQMADIGFMPGRGWLGTDLPRLRPDVRTIEDPYTGETLMAFPAIRPNIAVLHVLQADRDGNAVLGLNKGVDMELAQAADTVVITTEEVVPELKQADLVAPYVAAVVHVPRGAAPTSCHPLYPLGGHQILDYTERVSDPKTFQDYLARFLL